MATEKPGPLLQNYFFPPGSWSIQRPPEAQTLTSAALKGYQILAVDTSFQMTYYLLTKNKTWMF